jgi:serine/threonine-protein kinase
MSPSSDTGGASPRTLINSSTPEGEAGRVAIPGYEIEDILGKGGMGVVYKARQSALNRTVALKMILNAEHAADSERKRFRTEAEAIARLQHPNIVQIYEVGEHHGAPFLSLEFCARGSLAERLNGTPWDSEAAALLVLPLTLGIHAAHQAKVIHRDLKPANVLMTADGTPKITDFGLAKKLDEQGQTQSGAVMGTPSYMAPEQAGCKPKEVGPATDVYAIGAILYELLTGRPPFKGPTTLDTVMQVLESDPVPPRLLNPGLNRDLEAICLKCLEKNPSRRYHDAACLADDLERFLTGEQVTARSVNVLGRLARALEHTRLDADFHAWGSLLLAWAVIVFATHVVSCVLVHTVARHSIN